MSRIYISSTVEDLRDFRVEIYKAVRRLGHQANWMEDWAPTDLSVVKQCIKEVRKSDVFILLVAWRYGYVPPGQDVSISELELRTAQEAGIPCLVFLVPNDAPWPPAFFDADMSRIRAFRDRLLGQFIVDFFQTPEELAVRLAAALHTWTAKGASGPPTVPTALDATKAPLGPEVFISYAREDAVTANNIAIRLGKERWSVFWDQEIPVGLRWDDIVERALDAAKCVVVLWSSMSRESEWVRIEANEGAERGILAPALLEDVKIPLRFRRIQAANLIGWTPEAHDTPGLVALLAAIRRCLAAPSKDGA